MDRAQAVGNVLSEQESSYQRLIDLNILLRQDPAPSLVSVNDERQRLERLEADLEEAKTKFKRYTPDWPLRIAVLGRLDQMLDRVIADSRRIVDYINHAEQSGRLTMEQQRAQERQEREHERRQRQKEDLTTTVYTFRARLCRLCFFVLTSSLFRMSSLLCAGVRRAGGLVLFSQPPYSRISVVSL